MLLGEILVRRKFISFQQLEKGLIEQKTKQQKLGAILLNLGFISYDELKVSLKEQYWRTNGYWVIGAIDRPINYQFNSLEKVSA
jgi:hypothetical protein